MQQGRLVGFVSGFLFLAGPAGQAVAQPVFSNPFMTAEEILAQRGPPAPATLRIVYRSTAIRDRGTPEEGELVVLAAGDWAHVSGTIGADDLHDFRLGRVFQFFDEGAFASVNAIAPVAGRVLELQNRTMLAAATQRAGLEWPTDICDEQSSLGLRFPSSAQPIEIEEIEEGDVTTVFCNRRAVGTWTRGAGEAPPLSFWPAIASVLHIHPAVLEGAQADGAVPAALTASFAEAGEVHELTWILESAEAVSSAYPLLPGASNVTGAIIDQATEEGVGELAASAIAGTALDGPPTLETWETRLATIAQVDGLPTAVMNAATTIMMFPEVGPRCRSGANLYSCWLFSQLATARQRDPAVNVLFMIGQSNSSQELQAVFQGMMNARSSPLFHHPILGAAFALTLFEGGDEFRTRVANAGLPTDPRALQIGALKAYPYQPAYWTDFGDGFGRDYDWLRAMMFYDIATALPVPGASGANPVIASKIAFAERIRADFPGFFLRLDPQRPSPPKATPGARK